MLPLISHALQGHMSLKFWRTYQSTVVCMSVIFILRDAAITVCSQTSSVTEKRMLARQTHATSTKNGLHARTGLHKEKQWIRYANQSCTQNV